MTLAVAEPITHPTQPKPRYSHAVPHGSSIALCGRKAGKPSTGQLERCPDCTRLAQQRNHAAR